MQNTIIIVIIDLTIFLKMLVDFLFFFNMCFQKSSLFMNVFYTLTGEYFILTSLKSCILHNASSATRLKQIKTLKLTDVVTEMLSIFIAWPSVHTATMMSGSSLSPRCHLQDVSYINSNDAASLHDDGMIPRISIVLLRSSPLNVT